MAFLPRCEAISRIPIADAGRPMSDQDLHKARMLQRNNAIIDMPALGRLRASELCDELVVMNNQLYLQLSLEELPQLGLNLWASKPREPQPDEFAQDVALVLKQRDSIRDRFEFALSPQVCPDSKLSPSSDWPAISKLRKRISRSVDHKGYVAHSGWPLEKRVPVGCVPKFLHQGPALKVRARIHQISSESLTLVRVEVLGSSPEADHLRGSLMNKRRVSAHRQRAQTRGVEATKRLAIAMELGEVIEFEVTAGLSYVDADATTLCIEAICDARVGQAELALRPHTE